MPIHNSFHHTGPHGGSVQAFPDGLRIIGPILAVQIEIPTALANQLQLGNQTIPNPVAGQALIDTGASVSAVDAAVVQQLGVQPVGIANVGTAGGPQQQTIYPAKFSFPGTNLPSIEFGELLGANLAGQQLPLPQGQLIALLGRDILQHFILVYNGPGGMYSIAL